MLEEEASRLAKGIASINAYLKTAPKEKLTCSTSHNVSQYYVDGHYVKKKYIDHIKELAQRDYYKSLLPELQIAEKIIRKLLSIYGGGVFEKVFTDMCHGRQLVVTPMYKPKDVYAKEWEKEEYDRLVIGNDVRSRSYTDKGEHVRSKSEKIIADTLNRFNVPYKYEYPLMLETSYGMREFRPDFMALNVRTGKVYIIEHLGMMGDDDYIHRTINKLDVYEHNGYLVGRDILLTHETYRCPLDTRVLENYITEYLL